MSLSASPSCPSSGVEPSQANNNGGGKGASSGSSGSNRSPDQERRLSVIEQVGREVRAAGESRGQSMPASQDALGAKARKTHTAASSGASHAGNALTPLDEDNSYAKAIRSSASRLDNNGFSSSCEEEDTDRYEPTTHSEGEPNTTPRAQSAPRAHLQSSPNASFASETPGSMVERSPGDLPICFFVSGAARSGRAKPPLATHWLTTTAVNVCISSRFSSSVYPRFHPIPRVSQSPHRKRLDQDLRPTPPGAQ